MRFDLASIVSSLAAPLLLVASLAPRAEASSTLNIVQTAQANGNFNTLVTALQATGLDTTLSGPGRFTVFAPTDAAFAALPSGTVQSLLQPANLPTLSHILLYHVTNNGLLASSVVSQSFLTTINGQRVDVTITPTGVKIDNANLVITDVLCSNGVIHVIDAVLLPSLETIPQKAQSVGGFSTLLTAVTTAGLAPALSGTGPFTVFAPTDTAFAPLPVHRLLFPTNLFKLTSILSYHVVPGRIYLDQLQNGQILTTLNNKQLVVTKIPGLTLINGLAIQTGDVECKNGNIHVLSGVLIPSTF